MSVQIAKQLQLDKEMDLSKMTIAEVEEKSSPSSPEVANALPVLSF